MDTSAASRSTNLEALSDWREGSARQAIVEFVEAVCAEVPEEERVAVFDNDGTLWCEKPMPIQLDFILRRLVAMATEEPELQKHQPWKAAFTRDYAWFGQVMAEHYAGDDRNVETVAKGILAAYRDISVEEFEAQAAAFFASAHHPTLERAYLNTAYAPMIGLLRYLEAHGFTNYIASGGGRDFMRPISSQLYGIPRERVIGSASSFEYVADDHGGTITHKAELDYFDDGPQKPIRVWSRIGRRPILAAGNSNGDIPLLDFSQHPDKPSLRLLVRHDDQEREFNYTRGSEQALDRAAGAGWTVVSIADDWARVF